MSWRSPLIRLAIVGILGIGIFAGIASYREYERSERIQAEIDLLKQEADRIARENESLSQKIQYFGSPDFKEQEAKEKLGLKRQEEKVIAVQGVSSEEEKSAPHEVAATPVDWSEPHYKKWWKRFFHE